MILYLLILHCADSDGLALSFAIGLVAGYAVTIFTIVFAIIWGIKEKRKKQKYGKEVFYGILAGVYLFVFIIGIMVDFYFMMGYFAMIFFGLMAISGLCTFLFPILLPLF